MTKESHFRIAARIEDLPQDALYDLLLHCPLLQDFRRYGTVFPFRTYASVNGHTDVEVMCEPFWTGDIQLVSIQGRLEQFFGVPDEQYEGAVERFITDMHQLYQWLCEKSPYAWGLMSYEMDGIPSRFRPSVQYPTPWWDFFYDDEPLLIDPNKPNIEAA